MFAPDKGLVPKLRFPEFVNEWKVKRLGDDCEIQMCKRIFANQTSEKGDVPFYKIGTIGGSADAFISKELYSEYKAKYSFPRKGEVLITCAGTVGKTVIYDGEDAYYQDSNIVWISNPKQYYTNAFLQRVLSRIDWSKLNTTTIVRIYNDNLRDLKIVYPSKIEQDKISSLLKLIDERIATQNRAIEDLKRLRLAIQDKLIEQLVCSNDLKSFSEVYEVAGEGGTPDTSKREYYEGGTIPFIKIDDLANKYLKEHKDSITELGMCKSSAWLVPANSLIFSNGATIGSASINSYPVATKQGVLGIVPKNNISVEYLYYLMTSTYFKKQVHRIITHGTMATAYLRDINKIAVPIPNIDKQKYVSLVLSSLSRKEDIEIQMLCRLQNQKQYLLQRMFI